MVGGEDAEWRLAPVEDTDLCTVLEPIARYLAEKEWHEKCSWTCRSCRTQHDEWPRRFDWMSAKQHAIEYVVCSQLDMQMLMIFLT